MKLALMLGYSGGTLDLPMERIKLAEKLATTPSGRLRLTVRMQ